jgi:homoserine O-succinyltransferase/O-acetyltransferase
MPLVAHTPLPTFEKLRHRGQEVLTLDRALAQDIRELHIGLLNMMPDAAFEVTEQQYMSLVGASNQIVQFFVYPFTVPGLTRSEETQQYIDQHYVDFSRLQGAGLDALIITGANVTNPRLEQEAFWQPLQEVIAWASEHVTSILCSCLATHALVQHLHGIYRHPLPRKCWGVYSHRVQDRSHPLMQNMNTRFDVPHSRWNEVRREDMVAAGLHILVESETAGVHVAVSPDQCRIVYLQAHPEYDRNSLLKEYKREVLRFLNGELSEPPPHPEHYFSDEARQLAGAYLERAIAARKVGAPPPPFPEEEFEPHLDNTWGDSGRALFNNWLGLVYRLTSQDRRLPFMEGIDPADPLGFRKHTTGDRA